MIGRAIAACDPTSDVRADPWLPPPADLALAEGHVHVWRACLRRLAQNVERFAGTLSPDEARRAGRFRSAEDRRRFIVARGVVRLLLGRYLGSEPASLVFRYGPAGKPELSRLSGAADLRFNYTHSGGLILCAITRGRRIGVDIEAHRPIPELERIVQVVLTSGERQQLACLRPRERRDAFFRAWTRKEAFLKATGDGLSRPAERIEVSLAPRGSPLLLAVDGDPDAAGPWQLRDLPAGRGYSAALAVEGAGHRTIYRQY